MKTRRFLFLISFLLIHVALSAQCSMCRAVAESGNTNGQSIGGGLNNAILYLMAAPYLLLMIFFRKKIWGFLKQLRSTEE